jgi:hypothetical protein
LVSDIMRLLVEWQGGGVAVGNGNVDFNSCHIYDNTASRVRLPPLETPWTSWSYHMRKVSDW